MTVMSTPAAQYIVQQQMKGVPRSMIIENLVKAGHSFEDIRKVFIAMQKLRNKKKIMDWRSPTAINETSRMIRNDIRTNKISYSLGMTILIRARNTLKSMIMNPRKDHRLAQITQEIQTTKRLLMPQHANYDSKMNYAVYDSRMNHAVVS